MKDGSDIELGATTQTSRISLVSGCKTSSSCTIHRLFSLAGGKVRIINNDLEKVESKSEYTTRNGWPSMVLSLIRY